MNFIADEGIDAPIVELLRAREHNVLYIKEEFPGLPDEEVLKIGNNRKEILITQDKDFGELVYRLKQLHSGVILIRLSGLKPKEKALMVASVIEVHGSELHGSFTVINKTHIKIRK